MQIHEDEQMEVGIRGKLQILTLPSAVVVSQLPLVNFDFVDLDNLCQRDIALHDNRIRCSTRSVKKRLPRCV